MAIGDDFAISSARVISYTGAAHGASGAGYYTVIAFHRWLQDLADDAEFAGDDIMDIVQLTPSDRQGIDNIIALQNGYTITQEAVEHLYDGSIIMNDGDDIWDSVVVLSGTDTDFEVRVIQNGAVISAALTTGNSFWNNTPFGASNPGLNADAANGISTRFLLKVRTAGADIDGRRIVGYTRVWGKTFSEFRINGTARGNNSLPLTFRDDLNNTTAVGTVAGWTTITNTTEGYASIDVEADAVPEFFYSEWNVAGFTKNQFYERMKWLTRSGETTNDIYGLDGELFRGITHEIALSGTSSGTFNAFEPVSWPGGTGQMLAIDNTTASSATKMWIQLLSGSAPTTELITGGTSSATATATSNTERTISTPFVGASTGTAIIGAYGFGIEAADLSAADTLFDLDNSPVNAPNNVQFSVNGVVASEDRILVTNRGYALAYDNEALGPFTKGETLTFTSPAGTAKLNEVIDNGSDGFMFIGPMLTGSPPQDNSTISGGTSSATADVNGDVSNTIDYGQLTQSALVNGAAVTSLVMNETIPTDTPTSGTIRVQRASGVYSEISYTSYTGSTFTIPSTDFSTDNALQDDNVYVAYIDKLAASDPESVTVVYDADRTVFVRVRDGGGSPIKTVETTGVIGTAGGSATVNRQADD